MFDRRVCVFAGLTARPRGRSPFGVAGSPGVAALPAVSALRAVMAPAVALALALLFPLGPVAAQSRDTEAGRRQIMERMIEEIREDHPDVATISAAEFREALPGGDFVLVDVRTERERRVSTLPGAIPASEFERRLAELANRTVVVYCTIGHRSSSYAREMGRRGVDVLNLEGSVLAWTHAGGPLVHEGMPTKRLHVYGRRWNLAADGYETVW